VRLPLVRAARRQAGARLGRLREPAVAARVGLLTFEHQGCPAFEASQDDPAGLAAALENTTSPPPEDTA
jgi:hypothetical protein